MKVYQNLSRVAILSDTHGLLRPSVLPYLHEIDLILHAGDVGKKGNILKHLAQKAPIHHVSGNIDTGAWAQDYPFDFSLRINDQLFYMVHRKVDIPSFDHQTAPHWVIFGHSHKPEFYQEDQTYYLNPGSIGPRRFKLPISFAILKWLTAKQQWDPTFIRLEK